MGGNGRFPLFKLGHHRKPDPSHGLSETTPGRASPKEFICPICKSLISDPVVVSTGQTFDRLCVEICKKLDFVPTLADGSRPDFSAVIPNLAFKSTIIAWCNQNNNAMVPQSLDYTSVERIVMDLIAKEKTVGKEDRELIDAVKEKPDFSIPHAVTELAHRANHFYCSSASGSSTDESVIIPSSDPHTPPLPLTTRPECLSFSSASSLSENSQLADNVAAALNSNPISEDKEFVAKLKSPDIEEQQEGVIALREMTKSDEHSRVILCTPPLLSALKPLLISRHAVLQSNAVAAVVNLSLEQANKVKMVRSGIVPPLIDVLKGGFMESQEHAAGAIFSLSLEDDNKTAIGVLGALPPLIHALRSDSRRAQNDSALALYHLSLVVSNRIKLVRLGAVPMLLGMVRGGGNLAGRVLLVLCNVAACNEGRSAMLDGNAVECFVGMLRRWEEDYGRGGESESTKENCVAALYALSLGSLRFKGLAKEAGAVEVLKKVEEAGSERAKEKARRILLVMRGARGGGWDGDETLGDLDGVADLVGGLNRCRVGGRTGLGPNSTEF